MAEESKPMDPAEIAEAVTAAEASIASGKQPAVESDDDAEDTTDGHSATGEAPSGGHKKKSKRKRIKEALMGKPADPQASAQKALANLTPAQVTELMSLNPALAHELGIDPKAAPASGSSSGGLSEATEALKRLNLQDIITGLTASGKNVKDMGAYKFWQTQLVPRFEEMRAGEPIKEGPLKIQKIEDIPKEPYPLVSGFEWDTLDLLDNAQLKEVFELLNGHYVEDDESMFRFNYSKSILKWAMMPPGWRKEWFRGVRATQSKKLVAFIAGTPLNFRVRDNSIHGSEVNFICVHKKLRSKRLAPLLIKEITRLINLQGIWQALYTAGVVLPTPVSTCRYYHRALNWQKLYEIGFSPLPPNSKPQYQIRKYALPDHTSTKGLREMQPKDLDAAHDLLGRYLKRYDLVGEFSREESEHWLLYRDPAPDGEQVLWSYVVEDENKKITDLISFYCVESSIINNPKHRILRVAYLFYYATEVGLTTPVDKAALKTRLNALVNDALILAKQAKFDVFNALSIMDNALFIEDQKFGPGDGQLHYYLFNYRANPIAGGVNKRNQIDQEQLSGIGFAML